ncbi:MAG: NADH-quinone oxidoreductase subunit H [Phycisphaerae bacterium]|nr:NADH-quinone oxidoreductase subunit H [Phycisphaerae bacterium]
MIEFVQSLLASPFWFAVLWMLALIAIIMTTIAALILAERKISAYIQDRVGPNRVGPLGIFQPVADGAKFLLKEDIIPANVDRPIYFLASGMAFVIALLGFAIIPWAGDIHWPWMPPGQTVSTQVADINIGILYILAVGSMSVYGVVLAGWASNNKYAFYGGMRATAQMLSYEVPLGLGILCVLLVSGDLRLGHIVDQQAAGGYWNVLLQPIAFLLVLISGFAETNRTPFDLAEAEQELVGGYHTEYSAMKFALFFLGEYAHMLTNSALMVALFWGGWAPLPFLPLLAGTTGWVAALFKFAIFFGKVLLFLVFYMVIRWTIPRFRFDQLMSLAWRALVPIGIAAVLLTSLLAALGWQRSLPASILVNGLLVAGALVVVARRPARVTGRQPDLPDVRVTRPQTAPVS